jgi:hypothetical protein
MSFAAPLRPRRIKFNWGNSMANKNKSVFGIYSSRSAVENAVSTLKSSGFQHSDVSVLLPENLGSKEIATEKNTKAPKGATTGAGSGGDWWNLRLASWYRSARYPRLGTFYRRRTDHGCFGWNGSWWRCRWGYRGSGGHGHPGIRGQALRRTTPKGRNFDVRPLRHF